MNHLDALPDPCKDLCRITRTIQHSACVDGEDIALIKKICPEHGLFTRMSQLFYRSIADELRKKNIKYYSPENVQQLFAIIEDRLISRRLSNRKPARTRV